MVPGALRGRLLPFLVVSLLAALILMTAPVPVLAQAFPAPGKDLRHVIPWGTGGATDTAMRGFMQFFEKHLGIPVVTENIPGGLSAVGLLHVKTAPPDGYTIGTMTYDILTLELQGLAPVRWKDFELLGTVTDHPSALMVASGRWYDLAEFRAEASARPGGIKVGNVGTGGVWHQHAAAMEKALGVRVSHVPYEAGSGAQLSALLGGEVDAIVTSLPAALPFIRDGALRALGVMSQERDELVSDTPTFREAGFDVVYGSFRIVVAPKGTPQPIVEHLEHTLHDAWEDADFQKWARKTAIGARWRSREETREYLEDLSARVRLLMDELGLK